MKINENLNLILNEIYVYDIISCHYTLMKKNGYNLDGVDANNKLERNIAIGKMMQKNPRLTEFLRSTTTSLIDEYIKANDVKDEEIVIRQYDGLLLTKMIHKTEIQEIPLSLRKTFEKFITSINRNSYIAIDTMKNISIKGIPYRYLHMDNMYGEICKLNFGNKIQLFIGLEKIKNKILKSDDINLFTIPSKNKKFSIFLLGYGEMEISPGTIKLIDTDEIDKQRYFDIYLSKFTKSIVAEYA